MTLGDTTFEGLEDFLNDDTPPDGWVLPIEDDYAPLVDDAQNGSGLELELTPFEPKSTYDSMIANFPFETIRPVQYAGLEVIAKTYDSGKQITIGEFPTGAGKSPISMAVGGFASTMTKSVPGAHILTSQNNLLGQMMGDFGDKGLVQIRGKANYVCKTRANREREIGEDHPLYGKRRTGLLSEREDGDTDCGTGSLMNGGKTCDDCPYRDAKNLFNSSGLGVTNYTYYLTEQRYVGEIGDPHYLILDEAHNLEDEILGMVHIDITTYRADDLNIDLPKFDANAQGRIRRWLNETFMPAAEKRDNYLRAELARYQQQGKMAVEGSKDRNSAEKNAKLIAREQQSLANLMVNVGGYLDDTDSTKWFAWTGDKGQLTIRPLSAAEYAKQLLYSRAPHILMMSATILDFQTFERNLGIEKKEVDTFAAPSDFATSNRRLVYWPSGSMSYREAEATIPNISRRAELLLTKHAENKGIIHTHSYKINDYMQDYFSRTPHRHRIITHTNKPGAREEAIAKHIASEDPTILMSPSMTEGLDLKGNLSRLQIICKIPYPMLDPYTRARMERDDKWYQLKTALALVQATGRSVRSLDDWAITVILDSAFERFLIQNQDILPDWWKAAIEFK